MPSGKKKCPECNEEQPAAYHKCIKCDTKFVRKPSVVPNKLELKKGESRRGVKICPKCDTAAGGRTALCKECGFDFLEAKSKIDKDKPDKGLKICKQCEGENKLSAKKCILCNNEFPKKSMTLDSKKMQNILNQIDAMDSTELNILNDHITLPASVVGESELSLTDELTIEEIVEEERKIEDLILIRSRSNIASICPHCKEDIKADVVELEEKYTPKVQALRVIGYGDDKAEYLYKYSVRNKCWNHIDWEEVKSKITIS